MTYCFVLILWDGDAQRVLGVFGDYDVALKAGTRELESFADSSLEVVILKYLLDTLESPMFMARLVCEKAVRVIAQSRD